MRQRAASSDEPTLDVVYSRFQRHEPFTPALFTGFSSLRVLTYSASIPMIVQMLNQFDSIECVFGYEGAISNFASLLGSQRFICDELITAIQGLEDQRKRTLLEYIHQGKAHFYLVQGAISHSKLYLLESPTRRLVLTGSANWSQRAFSGKQYEELIAYENDERAWNYFERRYRQVRERATRRISTETLRKETVLIEDLPIMQEAQKAQEKEGITVFVHSPTAPALLPRVVHVVERLAEGYKPAVQAIVPVMRGGQIQFTAEQANKIIHLVKSRKKQGQEDEEPTWLSINRESRTVLLAGKEIALTPAWSAVQSDVACLIEYFENFR